MDLMSAAAAVRVFNELWEKQGRLSADEVLAFREAFRRIYTAKTSPSSDAENSPTQQESYNEILSRFGDLTAKYVPAWSKVTDPDQRHIRDLPILEYVADDDDEGAARRRLVGKMALGSEPQWVSTMARGLWEKPKDIRLAAVYDAVGEHSRLVGAENIDQGLLGLYQVALEKTQELKDSGSENADDVFRVNIGPGFERIETSGLLDAGELPLYRSGGKQVSIPRKKFTKKSKGVLGQIMSTGKIGQSALKTFDAVDKVLNAVPGAVAAGVVNTLADRKALYYPWEGEGTAALRFTDEERKAWSDRGDKVGKVMAGLEGGINLAGEFTAPTSLMRRSGRKLMGVGADIADVERTTQRAERAAESSDVLKGIEFKDVVTKADDAPLEVKKAADIDAEVKVLDEIPDKTIGVAEQEKELIAGAQRELATEMTGAQLPAAHQTAGVGEQVARDIESVIMPRPEQIGKIGSSENIGTIESIARVDPANAGAVDFGTNEPFLSQVMSSTAGFLGNKAANKIRKYVTDPAYRKIETVLEKPVRAVGEKVAGTLRRVPSEKFELLSKKIENGYNAEMRAKRREALTTRLAQKRRGPSSQRRAVEEMAMPPAPDIVKVGSRNIPIEAPRFYTRLIAFTDNLKDYPVVKSLGEFKNRIGKLPAVSLQNFSNVMSSSLESPTLGAFKDFLSNTAGRWEASRVKSMLQSRVKVEKYLAESGKKYDRMLEAKRFQLLRNQDRLDNINSRLVEAKAKGDARAALRLEQAYGDERRIHSRLKSNQLGIARSLEAMDDVLAPFGNATSWIRDRIEDIPKLNDVKSNLSRGEIERKSMEYLREIEVGLSARGVDAEAVSKVVPILRRVMDAESTYARDIGRLSSVSDVVGRQGVPIYNEFEKTKEMSKRLLESAELTQKKLQREMENIATDMKEGSIDIQNLPASVAEDQAYEAAAKFKEVLLGSAPADDAVVSFGNSFQNAMGEMMRGNLSFASLDDLVGQARKLSNKYALSAPEDVPRAVQVAQQVYNSMRKLRNAAIYQAVGEEGYRKYMRYQREAEDLYNLSDRIKNTVGLPDHISIAGSGDIAEINARLQSLGQQAVSAGATESNVLREYMKKLVGYEELLKLHPEEKIDWRTLDVIENWDLYKQGEKLGVQKLGQGVMDGGGNKVPVRKYQDLNDPRKGLEKVTLASPKNPESIVAKKIVGAGATVGEALASTFAMVALAGVDPVQAAHMSATRMLLAGAPILDRLPKIARLRQDARSAAQIKRNIEVQRKWSRHIQTLAFGPSFVHPSVWNIVKGLAKTTIGEDGGTPSTRAARKDQKEFMNALDAVWEKMSEEERIGLLDTIRGILSGDIGPTKAGGALLRGAGKTAGDVKDAAVGAYEAGRGYVNKGKEAVDSIEKTAGTVRKVLGGSE